MKQTNIIELTYTEVDAIVKSLLRTGQYIIALKVYRQYNECDVSEAKLALEKIKQSIE